jgi:hypothetical protein
MKRLLIYFGAGSLALVLAVVAWAVFSKIRARRLTTEPLRVTVSSLQPTNLNIAFDHYIVRVENISTKTIRGFSLGHTCRCRSWDSDNNPYPPGVTFTNPSPERQVLRPGDTVEMPLAADHGPQPTVWVDFVHFANDGNWGANRSRKDGYVRGY